MKYRWALVSLSFFVFSVAANPTGANAEERRLWQDHFVIAELTPVVDPQMERLELVHMCLDPRIHQMELEPSARGGISKTRIAVRPDKEGSVFVQLDDHAPGYRLYQAFARGFILPALSWVGAEHIFPGPGPVSFADFRFDGDPTFPLHFKYVDKVGYVHLCGRGTVYTPGGASHLLDSKETTEDLLARLKSPDQLTREAACTALGYLAIQAQDKGKVLSALAGALKDSAMEVRRNAAEALDRIGDPRSLEDLKTALKDDDDWVRDVAAHGVARIAGNVKSE